MARKSSAGSGSIRKKTQTINGKTYTHWEARITVGYDPGTGKQIQRTITGKTQKEVATKLREIASDLDKKTYMEPCKMTVAQWLDIWVKDYLNNVKPATVCSYTSTVETHLKPKLGALKLEALAPHEIQSFYNSLTDHEKNPSPVSAKTAKNIHGVLHKALQQAVKNGYIRANPTEACELPKVEKKKIKPLDEEEITRFLRAIRGHQFEDFYVVTLFTGMRKAEAMGLTWDCVNLEKGTITVNKQLQQVRGGYGEYRIAPTKNSKVRTITVAPFVVNTLCDVRKKQLANRIRNGIYWEESNFVFTDEIGRHYKTHTVYKNFKAIVKSLGLEEARLHDLRHSYAVASLKSGDDIKTLQEHLGHATASFTLDVYGHVTEKMQQESAARMEQFIKAVNK